MRAEITVPSLAMVTLTLVFASSLAAFRRQSRPA
jgi:hypothetical protein